MVQFYIIHHMAKKCQTFFSTFGIFLEKSGDRGRKPAKMGLGTPVGEWNSAEKMHGNEAGAKYFTAKLFHLPARANFVEKKPAAKLAFCNRLFMDDGVKNMPGIFADFISEYSFR